MKNIYRFLPFACCFILEACVNHDSAFSRGAGGVYLDYKISAEEGYDQLTVLIRVRAGGPHEDALLLTPPSTLDLDGELFPADSSALLGPFYELNRPMASFAGTHVITYTDSSGKKYTREFNWQPLTLAQELPDSIRRGRFHLQFNGLGKEDYVRVLMTDTSFLGPGVNELDTVMNGDLPIGPSQLDELGTGPVTVELVRERDEPIRVNGQYLGRLRSFYTIRRSFVLLERTD